MNNLGFYLLGGALAFMVPWLMYALAVALVG
jgi:hypothetical protein